MSNSYIYTGVWVNWSQGSIYGWTLTLPSTKGQFLVAFLAVFVTITGARLWIVLSFLIHQLRAASTLGDGRHQQVQVILRNSSSPLGASWELISLGWSWRKVKASSYWSLVLLALLGLLHASCWAVASIFSSQITNTVGNEALIRSPDCGYYIADKNAEEKDQISFTISRTINSTTDATSYARLCYGQSGEKSVCNRYTVPQVPWTANTRDTCPFDLGFCRLNGSAAAFKMDTGVLNSQSVFGFNTPPSHEIGYRKVTTCAPLRIPEGFSQVVNKTNLNNASRKSEVLQFYLGSSSQGNSTFNYNLDAAYGSGYGLLYVLFISADLVLPGNSLNSFSVLYHPLAKGGPQFQNLIEQTPMSLCIFSMPMPYITKSQSTMNGSQRTCHLSL